MKSLKASISIYEEDQRKLDEYTQSSLTNKDIGTFYERYIGYLYEIRGYRVAYTGIKRGFEDLGQDLIATKGKETLIIQCKMWSKKSLIHEKHIYQLHGTTCHYRLKSNNNIRSIFVSTCELSEQAKKAATDLNISFEYQELDKNYPKIKCNINRHGHLYFLPFEKTYDNIQICSNEGEFFVHTVEEALAKGFESPKKNKLAA